MLDQAPNDPTFASDIARRVSPLRLRAARGGGPRPRGVPSWEMSSVVLGAMLALSLIVGGCGSSDSDGEAAPSKAKFLLDANAICATSGNVDPGGAVGRDPSPIEFGRFVRGVVVPTIQEEVDAIRALTPPEGDEKEISAILDSAQAAIDEVKAHPGALNARQNPFRESTRLAHAYGLDACGGG
jgi:hypothetical protein